MDALVSADRLAGSLNDPALRVFDATVQVSQVLGIPVVRRGRRGWRRGHIPGATYVDLMRLSHPNAPGRTFTMPDAAWFAGAIGEAGAATGTRVVVYDARENMWAARLWWMLRAFGFDDAAVLDGGWTAWRQASYPICTKPCAYPPGNFVATPRPGLIVGRQEVLGAIDDPSACLLNALGHRQHRGEINEYGRRGHIPHSCNVSAWEILDRETQRYRPEPVLRDKLDRALRSDRVITYCGGGVASSSVAMTLVRLGHPNVAVYDGGLQEWCADPDLPLEVGP